MYSYFGLGYNTVDAKNKRTEKVARMSTSSGTNPSARAAYERYKLESSPAPVINLKTDGNSKAVPLCKASPGSQSAKKIILAYENGLQ